MTYIIFKFKFNPVDFGIGNIISKDSAKLLADHGENSLKKKYNIKVLSKPNVLKKKNYQEATASFKCNQSFNNIFGCESNFKYEFKYTGDGK